MSHVSTAQEETEDRYFAQFDDRTVRLMTLEELDSAFEAGKIHENTYVCLEGSSEWLTLAEVAGLGEEDESEAAPVSQVSSSPLHRDEAPPSLRTSPAHSGTVPLSAYAQPARAVQPRVASTDFYQAPMIVAPSIAPVVNEVDDSDPDFNALRPKRHMGKFLGAAAVLLLGGVGAAVATSGGISLPKLSADSTHASAESASLTLSKVQEASAPAPVAAAPVPAAADPTPAPAAAAPIDAATSPDATGSADKAQGDARFTEDMKAALLASDKAKTATAPKLKSSTAAKSKQARSTPAKRAKQQTKATGALRNNGSAYDPLNGKL